MAVATEAVVEAESKAVSQQQSTNHARTFLVRKVSERTKISSFFELIRFINPVPKPISVWHDNCTCNKEPTVCTSFMKALSAQSAGTTGFCGAQAIQ